MVREKKHTSYDENDNMSWYAYLEYDELVAIKKYDPNNDLISKETYVIID